LDVKGIYPERSSPFLWFFFGHSPVPEV